MPLCLRCDPVLYTGYDPYKPWPPGWGGNPGPITPPIDPNALAIFCPVVPATMVTAVADTTVTVNGQNITANCVAYLGATALATTPAPTASLTCVVPMGTAVGTYQITVQDTVAGTTAIGSCPFTVTAAPILTVVCPTNPASTVVGTAAIPVTVNGTLFTASCVVTVGGVDQATNTAGAPTSLTFQSDPAAPLGTVQVGVRDTVAGTTAATTCPFVYSATPLLTVVCPVVPATAVAGTPNMTVTVNGTNFVTGTTQATWNGVAQTTTFISATQISFLAPTSTAAAGTYQVGAVDGANTAAVTCPFVITPVATVRPTPTYVWPDLIGQDDPVKTVTVTGTNFDATTQVILTQTPMVTTYISPTQVSFVTVSPMWTNGTMTLRVRNGGTVQGEGTTTIPFGVWNNPASTGVVSLMPTSAAANSGIVAVQMGVSDAPGAPLSQVTVDDVPVPTTGSGTLSFQIDTTGVAPGTIRKCSVRVGHDHPEGHDNITPQPMQYGDFTIT